MMKTKKTPRPSGYILYVGPSLLDGVTPIVVIATGIGKNGSANSKTGASVIQTWILRADMDPLAAVKNGGDKAVCGNCPYASMNGCYVNAAKGGPLQVFKKYARGGYPVISPDDFGVLVSRTKQMIRIGSYGDPTAAPIGIWQDMLDFSGTGNLGYTHQWHRTEFQPFKAFLMASCDTPAQAEFAIHKGWRVFLVTAEPQKLPGFVTCPASKEHEAITGKKLTCATCKICNGSDSKYRKSITIASHGGIIQQRLARKTLLMLNVA